MSHLAFYLHNNTTSRIEVNIRFSHTFIGSSRREFIIAVLTQGNNPFKRPHAIIHVPDPNACELCATHNISLKANAQFQNVQRLDHN